MIELSDTETEIAAILAITYASILALVVLAGFFTGATQSLILQAATSPDAWKFYPKLERKWQAIFSGFMPRLPPDRRRLVLDLKTNRSLAPTVIAGGSASLVAFICLLPLCSQIERLTPLWVFALPCFGSLYLGVLVSGFAYWLQMVSSRRRHFLRTAVDLMQQARDFGPTSSSKSKEYFAASGRRFLRAADRLGIPSDNRNLKSANSLLTRRSPLSPRKVRTQLIPNVEMLVRSTYGGDFATSTSLGPAAIFSSKLRARLATWSSSALGVALLAAFVAWLLGKVHFNF
ncbi:hypothetical protein J3A64_004275 [Pseudarthrobacter sp. PvP004]|uniref:hypothetical protein n=1 Tax=Pseudarthrobacter sp. PvP004 TaxID=2817850 RepID=UPI001AE774A1|nr:hypothetical protein [Pseudarthrobacter sp. PvP004]MBP2268811.1 hypothetical protein [Pseudarthrobacter sp. PvP004]